MNWNIQAGKEQKPPHQQQPSQHNPNEFKQDFSQRIKLAIQFGHNIL